MIQIMFKNLIRSPYPYILLFSYYCVWLSWDSIKLPFHNPAGIISALPEIGYNPSNNILRFLFAILVPPLTCLLVWALINKKPKRIWDFYNRFRFPRITIATIAITATIMLCVFMGIVQASTNPERNPTDVYGGPYSHALVDTFHEGETLGPAISYAQPELAPYRDFVIVHGVFQDALRTNIAFDLFGHSIGASRAFASILTILTVVAYFILLLVLFRGNVYKSILGLLLVALLMLPTTTLPIVGDSIFGINLPFRDLATIAFLITAIIGLRAISNSRNKKKLAVASFLIGFITLAGFANSIDRALYIAVLSIVWLVLALILNSTKPFLKTILLPYLAGIIVGIPVLGIALKWAFSDFFAYLVTMSKYKEFLDGIIFTRPTIAITIILVIVAGIITIFGSILIKRVQNLHIVNSPLTVKLRTFIAHIKPLIEKYSIAILLAVTGLFFLRSAIGRALPDHWIYSVQWLYLFLAFVGINFLFRVFSKRTRVINLLVIFLLGACLAVYGLAVKHIDVRNDTFPIHVQDKELMRTDYIETSDYLKANLKKDENFVTLTSEASWYYFVDKPSPIQYPVIWYAFTKSQRDVIANQLDNKPNIKYAITNNNWTSDFDYVPNEVRFPEVYTVLKKDYVPYIGFGQQTIWIRK